MKKSELKNIIRQIVKEQRGMAPGPVGQTMGTGGGGTRPPLPTAPVGGQTQATGGSQTGGVTPTGGSGVSPAQFQQMQALALQLQKTMNSVGAAGRRGPLGEALQKLKELLDLLENIEDMFNPPGE